MRNGTFWVVEHLCQVFPFAFFKKLAFLELIHRLYALFVGDSFFSALFSFSIVKALISLSVGLIGGHTFKLLLNIAA